MYKKHLKRCVDFLISALALIVLSPLMLILVILVKTKMGSPVIFKQERPGLHEKSFMLFELRTMTDKRDGSGQLLGDAQRLTRFGAFLRKTSLDELPELVNILKGDMSIIGPRPLLVKYLPYYSQEERKRHDLRPGLTGLAQVCGRNNLRWEERFALDVEYVNSISFGLDIKIFLKTILLVFERKNIVPPGVISDFDVYREKQIGYYKNTDMQA